MQKTCSENTLKPLSKLIVEPAKCSGFQVTKSWSSRLQAPTQNKK